MERGLRQSGIGVIGDVPWGTHFCQFYRTKQDLIDILVPYFKAGLENNEFCMWVTAEPLETAGARAALENAVPDLDRYIRKGQIEIIPHSKWYLLGGTFNEERVLNGWVSKLEQALESGYSGLRLTGNTFWLEEKDWRAFADYEAMVNSIIGKYRMLAVCTYSLDKCDGSAVIDVVKNHQFAMVKQEGKWDIIESSTDKRAKEELRASNERLQQQAEELETQTEELRAQTEELIELANALREGEERLERSQEIARLGSWELDVVNNRLTWSDEVYRIFGLEPQEFGATYEAFLEAVHSGDRGPVDAAYSDSVREGRDTYEIEHRVVRKRTGETRHVHEKCRHVRDKSGRIVRSIGMVHDVTERRQAEQALRESEQKYRGLFEHMSEAAVWGEIILGGDGKPWDFRILDLNDAWAKLAGINREDVKGKTRREIFPVIDPYFIQAFGEVALTGTPMRFERYSPALGTWAENHVFSPREGQFVEVSTDITERKKAEEIKDEFIGMVSHELKTPLTVVTGALNTAMTDGVSQEEARELMGDAAWGAETMADIVDNLLELSRYQSRRLVLQPSPLDVGRVLNRMVEQSSKKSGQHRVVADVPAALPVVRADLTRVERILDNLIDNAIKYSPRGGEVWVSARQEGDHILISVSDQGIGIPAADVERLFQPFQRLESVPGTAIQGVGLGLVVCRRLVEAHGGSIWVESRPAEGSTFFFTLPLVTPPAQ